MLSIQKKQRQSTSRSQDSLRIWCTWSTCSLVLFSVLLSEMCATNKYQGSVTAFQGTLPSRKSKVPPSTLFTPHSCYVKDITTVMSTQYSVHPGQSPVLTRLYDTERSEAEMKLSAQLDPTNEGNISASTFELQQQQTNVSTTTLMVQPDNSTEDSTTFFKGTDVPLPTDNGGFTHTSQSRAKISAANKGKTPWNKGKARSPEVRARIAAGVRAKNRDTFLKKLIALNVTEEQYNEDKLAARRVKDAAHRARKTPKGGYRPTNATKEKISKILKAKWANGEISKRSVDPTKVRRGFTHTEETRAKISKALKKRWANDAEYREKMVNKTTVVNSSAGTRKKISETLKAKWQDPVFRDAMMEKIRSRRKTSGIRDENYRRKISEAMKKKWKDAEYRNKTTASIQKRATEMARLRPPKPKKKSRPRGRISARQSSSPTVGIQLATVASPRVPRKPRTLKKAPLEVDANGDPIFTETTRKVIKKKKKRAAKKVPATVMDARGNMVPVAKKAKKPPKKKKAKKEPDGSINRLRDERRDLYDLLYGDEEGGGNRNTGASNIDNMDRVEAPPASDGLAAMLDLEDENLDNYDPYGLEDF